jgi:hypothetical protein
MRTTTQRIERLERALPTPEPERVIRLCWGDGQAIELPTGAAPVALTGPFRIVWEDGSDVVDPWPSP